MPRKCSTAVGAVLFVGVQDGFGIAARLVEVAGPLKGRAQIGVVEDFAVVDDPAARRPRWPWADARRQGR